MIVDVHVHPPKQMETQTEAQLSRPGYRGDKQYKTNVGWAEFQQDMSVVDKLILLDVARGSHSRNDEIARAQPCGRRKSCHSRPWIPPTLARCKSWSAAWMTWA